MSGHRSKSGNRVQLGNTLPVFNRQDCFRQPEVQDLHPAFGRDLDIGGLDVTVNDALGVSGLQGFNDLGRIIECLVDRELGR